MAMGKINHEFGLLDFNAVVRENDDHAIKNYPTGVNWMAGSTDGIAEDVRDLEDLVVHQLPLHPQEDCLEVSRYIDV